MSDRTGARLVYVTTVAGTQWSFLRGQNEFMREQGFEIHAIASPSPRLEALADRDDLVPHAVAMSRQLRPSDDLVALVRLTFLLRRVRPDILHVSTPKAAALGAIAGWIARVPVRLFLVRGLASEGTTGVRRFVYRKMERLTAALCHSSIAVSPSLLEYARLSGVLPRDRGMVIENGMSNGVDCDRFDPDAVRPCVFDDSEGAVRVGYVGRLAIDKGIREIAEMWKSVREDFDNAELLLVGSWEENSGDTSEIRRELEADPRVRLTGPVVDVVPYYAAMDIFVIPSYREGFPNAPMEAAAMRLPVVATDVAGCKDAVQDGVTGMLVPPRDAEALRRAVGSLLGDPDMRRRFGSNGRDRVRRDFQPEKIWRGLLGEYRRLLSTRPAC